MSRTKKDISSSFLTRLKKGEKRVIDDIYRTYHLKIFRFSLAYLKNEEDAYDLVQEVFVKLWENRVNLTKDTNFEALLFTISRNTILSVFRKRLTEKKYLEYLIKSSHSNNIGTKEITDYSFLQQQYEELIPQLPPKRKEIFLLSREKGLTNKEIASLKGISEKTVEDHLTKALSFLKRHMAHLGIWALLFSILFID